MATLDNSNVVNGQTVEATDITQLYTALGTGSPGTITGLVMTGSLEGNAATATLATSATTAVSSSYSSVTETSYVFTTPDSQTQATKGTWVPFGGIVLFTAGFARFDAPSVFTQSINPPIFGVNFIITGNQIVAPGTSPVLVSPSLNNTIITFEGATGDVMYQGWYLSL